MGSGDAKEVISTTHEHELRWGGARGGGVQGRGG